MVQPISSSYDLNLVLIAAVDISLSTNLVVTHGGASGVGVGEHAAPLLASIGGKSSFRDAVDSLLIWDSLGKVGGVEEAPWCVRLVAFTPDAASVLKNNQNLSNSKFV